MTLIEQIKAEVERRIKENEPLPHRYIRLDEDRQLLSFIESLEKGQPSLPSNLDEAVTTQMEEDGDVDYFVRKGIDEIALKYAKLGAKWMAGQFQKLEGELVDWYETNGVDYCHGISTNESFEVPEGFYIKKK